MLDTIEDGIVLIIEEDLVKNDDLALIRDFVDQHKLNLLLDSERYFISKRTLAPSILYGWDSWKSQ